VCQEARLVIEIDGPEHNQQARKNMDAKKQKDLEDQGYRVQRFRNGARMRMKDLPRPDTSRRRIHPDASSLASFKARLVEAAKARTLVLGRLDMPEGLPRELRERSETSWGSDEVHFVITAWN
jgi:Protein of unknown function (DUF559)